MNHAHNQGTVSQAGSAARQGRILTALMLRELHSRFGREGLGFFWIVAEPLLFCLGVMAVWTLIRPPYEHGIPLAAFVMTGYIPLLLIRHAVSRGVSCITANSGLLYHRPVSILHLFIARIALESVAIGAAFFITFIFLLFWGVVDLPYDLNLIIVGYLLLCFFCAGLTLVVGALSEMFAVVERVANLVTYLLVPISGGFFMLAWLPSNARAVVEKVPMIHAFEMLRAGFFGPSVKTYEDPGYLLAWSAGLLVVGLCLVAVVSRRDFTE